MAKIKFDKRISLTIDADTYEIIEEIQETNAISKSHLVRIAIKDYYMRINDMEGKNG